MDTVLPQKFPFILDRNLAKANCTGNQVCTSCDIVVLGHTLKDTRLLPALASTYAIELKSSGDNDCSM